jgi:argininosuccinate synthase
MIKMDNKKVVLLYSGGLDTSVSVKLLQEKYGLQVITVLGDVGQKADFKALEEKALGLGAIKHITVDCKQEFVKNSVWTALKNNALYCDYYPVSTSIARPIIALKAIEIAKKEGVANIAHGCKGRGADYFRFMIFLKHFAPELNIVSPITDWWPTRDEEAAYAFKHKIPVPITEEQPFSYDENLWGNAINYGDIDDIEKTVPESCYNWTVPVEEAPDKPETITIKFVNGVPTQLNGVAVDHVELIMTLNELGGKHGIGRVDMIEDGVYGSKFKWVYEVPAAQILIEAHKELERIVLPKDALVFKKKLDEKWADLAYHAFWFNPLIKGIEAFTESIQQYVDGEVTMKLYKGGFYITKRSTPHSLIIPYNKDELVKVPFGLEDHLFMKANPDALDSFKGFIG